MPSSPDRQLSRHERIRSVVDGLVAGHEDLFHRDPTYHAWVNAMAQLLVETSDGFAKALVVAPLPLREEYEQLTLPFPKKI
jgi:hypothetical protein